MKEKLTEEIKKIKSMMYENELKEFDFNDIVNYLSDKITGVFSNDDDTEYLDDIVTGTDDETTVSNINKSMKGKEVDKMSDEEKLDVYSKAITDDDIYKAILFGIGAPQTEHNINFLKYWRMAEMGRESINRKKITASNNPFNTTYNYSKDSDMKKYNSVGVKHYSKPEYGIDATVKTLKNGLYNCIVDGLRKEKDYEEIAGCTNAKGTLELNTWGTGKDLLLYVIKSTKDAKDVRKIDREIPKTT
jgi:hypothetical protein